MCCKKACARRKEFTRGKPHLEQMQALELEIKLTAHPRVRRGIGDLLRREALRRPVGRLRSFRDAKAEEQRRQRAYARLLEAVAPGDSPEVDERRGSERKHRAQLAYVVRYADAGLHGLLRREQLDQHGREIRA